MKALICCFFALVTLNAKAETPSISMHCPCTLERVNQTKVNARFSVVFHEEIAESGRLTLDFGIAESIEASQWIVAGRKEIANIPYSAEAQLINVGMPLSYASEQGLILAYLRDMEGSLVDKVVFTENSITYNNPAAVEFEAPSKIIFNSGVEFQHNGSNFSLNVASLTNENLKSVSDALAVKIWVTDDIGPDGSFTYYEPASVSTTIIYDSNGESSLSLSGTLAYPLENYFAYDSDNKNVNVVLYRGSDRLLTYLVKTLDGSSLASYEETWTNVDTLVDSDGDGLSDFNERLLGTTPNSFNSFADAVIEVAFAYGSSVAESSLGGSNLAQTLAHHIAVANLSFSQSGVGVKLVDVGHYEVGIDSGFTAHEILEGMMAREGVFAGIDNRLTRRPDLLVHYGTLESYNKADDQDGVGGLAVVQGIYSDGLIDYKNAYMSRTNNAVVAIDNMATTLAHELGHLMGLTHSKRQSEGPPKSTFPWALGHGVDSVFTTIMAYPDAFESASEIRFFSSPEIFCGEGNLACGVDSSDYLNGANSVKSMRTTAVQISAISNGFPPNISLAGAETINLMVGDSFAEPGFVAVDKEDGILTSYVSVTGAVNTKTAGTYTLAYSISDSDQNSVTATRSVIVESDINDSDDDRDGDGYINTADIFPDNSSEWYDSDADGIGDNADATYDPSGLNVGYLVNATDTCSSGKIVAVAINGFMYPAMMPGDRFEVSLPTGKHVFSYYQDGLLRYDVIRAVNGENWYRGLACSWDDFELSDYTIRSDSDNDKVLDYLDAFPQDAAESLDTDNDGIGNTADTDDDNDGYSDSDEIAEGTDPLDANSAPRGGLNLMLIKAAIDKKKNQN